MKLKTALQIPLEFTIFMDVEIDTGNTRGYKVMFERVGNVEPKFWVRMIEDGSAYEDETFDNLEAAQQFMDDQIAALIE